jgi:hypothetical protein
VTKQKDTEVRASHANNDYDPGKILIFTAILADEMFSGNPLIDFEKFFNSMLYNHLPFTGVTSSFRRKSEPD